MGYYLCPSWQLYGSLQKLLILPSQVIVLTGHSSQLVAFDEMVIHGTLAQVQEQTAVLAFPESQFVDTLLQRLPEKPPNHPRIVNLNEAWELPESNITDLEAGANRCTVD